MKKSLADFLLGLQDWEETGMDELSDLIEHMFLSGEISFNDQVYLTNMRHQAAMEQVQSSLMQIKLQIYTHIQLLFLCNSCRWNTFLSSCVFEK